MCIRDRDLIAELAERVNCSNITGEENRLSSSLLQDENRDAESERTESSTNVSPSHLPAIAPRLPLLAFKKADHLHSVSPLSLSVQCGSDSDDFENMHETVVMPTHRLTSKRVWNVNTCSWEDAVEHCSTDSVCSSHDTPDRCNFSDVAFLPMNRDTGKIVFTRADSAIKSTELVYGNNTLRFASRYAFSESNIQSAQSRLNERKNVAVVRNVDIGASNKSDHVLRTRHSVTGSSYDEKLVPCLREQATQSFYRAKSCPVLSNSVLPSHSVHTSGNVRRRRKESRFVGNVRRLVPKGSERRRRVSRIFHRHNLAPPLFASWPGKGDIKGSMLAYESSV